MKLAKWFGAAAVAVAFLGLAACGASNKESGNGKDKTVTIKIGTMTIDNDEQQRWDLIQKKLEKENVKLDFTQFTEYPQVNKAVADGELDVNAFQHYYYLNNWNKENNQDLVAIADTYIAPIRLYSGTKDGKNKYKKVNELPDGAEIAVPNDATNESRALNLLQAAGLIKLDKSGNELATVANIKENPKKLKITELDASQTARSLTSVDAAVVNNTFVNEAKLDYKKALFIEPKDKNSKQWYNIIAAKKDWEKSDKADAIKKLIAAYHSDDVKELTEKTSDGLLEPVW